MTDRELEARRTLLEMELGETLRARWEQLTQIWPLPAVVETMMLLGLGVLSGAYTPHQVMERLGLDKHHLYDALGEETAPHWRDVIQELGYGAFLAAVHRVLQQSASTRSRVCFTIMLDDSLFRRYAKQMASIFTWWGGAFKAVKKGDDVLGLMIEVHGRVFILDWVVVSKAGRTRKPRWKYAMARLQEFERRLQAAGIDPSRFGLALDWWYGQKDALVHTAVAIGLTVVTKPASNELFSVNGAPTTVRQIKEAFRFQSTWGGYPPQHLRAVSQPFGEVMLVLYQDGNTHTLLMATAQKDTQPDKELCALPVIRIHQQRPWIAQTWRWQKSALKTGTMQVRRGHKPKAGYTCRMVTSAIRGELQHRLRQYRNIGRQSIGTLLTWYQRLGSAFQVLGRTLKEQFSQLHPQVVLVSP
jgi:hypothetical protein